MVIYDDLYGEFEVDQVIEALILSEPVQRLKGIHQGGASYLVNKEWNVTRYEHSIGVLLLIKRLGGSVEEQIAGLLHDVSHTAFSHVVDFVLENEEEDYHEKIYQSVIEDSEIPVLLATYKYNYQDILLDDKQWTLLEQPAPELCADRVDYTLRDMYSYGNITLKEINAFLQDLIVVDGKMFLQNIKTAEWFVQTYYKEVIDFFMDPLNIYANDRLAKTLRRSIEKRVISPNDFLGSDNELISKIKASKDMELLRLLDEIHPNVNVMEDREHYDLHRKNKLRLIDPTIYRDGEFISASTVSESVRTMGNEAYEKATRGMFVRVNSN